MLCVILNKTPVWGIDNGGDWQENETFIPGRQNDNISM